MHAELAEEIRKETQKYFRHSSKNAGQALPGKDAAIPDTVSALYADIDALATEKVALADRLVKLVERAEGTCSETCPSCRHPSSSSRASRARGCTMLLAWSPST